MDWVERSTAGNVVCGAICNAAHTTQAARGPDVPETAGGALESEDFVPAYERRRETRASTGEQQYAMPGENVAGAVTVAREGSRPPVRVSFRRDAPPPKK
jgi:hypothetical protein